MLPAAPACRYITFALSIYIRSKGLYAQIRATGYVPLPSGRLLASYMQNNTNRPGWSWEEILRLHELYVRALQGDLRLGGLIFDAMKIMSGLLYSTSTKKLVGFTDIGDAALQGSLHDVLHAERDLEGACHEPGPLVVLIISMVICCFCSSRLWQHSWYVSVGRCCHVLCNVVQVDFRAYYLGFRFAW